ncbi:allose kinase [Acholeplasma equirhinis]|uniref:allose kinase n=1 Tax=Acholeplasma equirhinis TaxID=555393 RepID=UPI00197AA268|nr:allose kinase [Acholeplasma equirhinis]MBN3490277.1 allose kinase [Acholeplasma equirhinis]
MSYYIGVDVGGTNIRMGLVDENLNILHEEKYASSKYAPELSNLLKQYVEKHKAKGQIKAISLGFPGLVDQETRTVLHTPNERRFEGSYLMDLEKELSIPIVIGNDVNVLLMYDADFFGIDKNKSVLGFYLGTGFGNAIRIKGELYQGEFGAAGEIGHVPAYASGIEFDAEKQPDLEQLVSGFNLIEIHKKNFADSPFESLFVDHFNSKEIQIYLHILAFYIATEITILDIPTIILGGGVIMSEQFPKDYLESLIKKNLFSKLTKDNFKVYYAQADVKSGILGATIYAERYLKNLTK